MESNLSRREFLKITSTLSLMPLVNVVSPIAHKNLDQNQHLPNIIILVYDALSALHLSLYGYSRQTSPNLEKLANRSTVYHAHYAPASFTTPSTASLISGTYPWTHRATNLLSTINPINELSNLFQLLGNVYYQLAFTQNIFADILLFQFQNFLDRHANIDSFALSRNMPFIKPFSNDAIYSILSTNQFLFNRSKIHGSLFLSFLNDIVSMYSQNKYSQILADTHPDGLPRLADIDVHFINEQVTNGIIKIISELPKPSLAYIHLLPPHSPYQPTSDFIGMFNDGWTPQIKKRHKVGGTRLSQERLNKSRRRYDEYIANIDWEIGRILDHMSNINLLDNSYVIFTSDHGELFERGVQGHFNPLLFEPIIRVPLIISAPGQRKRVDIHSPTTTIDLLPTILKMAKSRIPNSIEGHVLPGFGGNETKDRSIFSLDAKENATGKPIHKSTTAMIKGRNKLIHYLGYNGYDDKYEFFNLKNDPDELENLYSLHSVAAEEMEDEMEQKFDEINQPYQN